MNFSGGHINPNVTLMLKLTGRSPPELTWLRVVCKSAITVSCEHGRHGYTKCDTSLLCVRQLLFSTTTNHVPSGYIASQIAGAFFGVMMARYMMGLEALEIDTSEDPVSDNGRMFVSEMYCSAGLLAMIMIMPTADIPAGVALFVGANVWFSTTGCFANPAGTLARGFSDTFAGVDVAQLPVFLGAELAGLIAIIVAEKVLHYLDRGNVVEENDDVASPTLTASFAMHKV
jgi:glycerol uptake facilitator-like aquaporin